jgi:aldehyde:ferredoxin oxidoreductase
MPDFSFVILRINLSQKKIQEERIRPSLIDRFLGGRGLGAKILFDELAPHVDALSVENKLLFLTGPLLGTGAPWCVKYTVVTKSPLSETILMSLAGGFFGPNLRFAGYDGLIIEGRSDGPIYLWIDNGKVEFRSATHLGGMTTDECQNAIRKELNQQSIEMACIGPAGEKSVRFACIISGWRAAGRGGAGAVMGAKNLKAIAVKGSRKVPIADPETFNKIQKAIRKKVPTIKRLKQFGKYGTPNNLVLVNARGLFPISTEGPEYETFWAFGAQCGPVRSIGIGHHLHREHHRFCDGVRRKGTPQNPSAGRAGFKIWQPFGHGGNDPQNRKPTGDRRSAGRGCPPCRRTNR